MKPIHLGFILAVSAIDTGVVLAGRLLSSASAVELLLLLAGHLLLAPLLGDLHGVSKRVSHLIDLLHLNLVLLRVLRPIEITLEVELRGLSLRRRGEVPHLGAHSTGELAVMRNDDHTATKVLDGASERSQDSRSK